MKESIYIILATVAISCLGCRERRNESHEKPEVISDTFVYEPTFLSKKLQDSLDAFMNAIDSFPNPYGPTIYTISVTYNECTKNTDLFLVAEGNILEGLSILTNFNFNYQEDKFRVLGAREVNGQIIAVCSYDIADPEKLFNLDVLDKKLYHEHVYNGTDAIIARPSARQYRLIGSDSLKVINITKSKYEKDINCTFNSTIHGVLP
ncbi:MAG: hypothetical protein J6B62_04700 [Bacteroidales bacterium]|nr:hypothetical protein [Bacteroidales bacterium]